MNRQEENLDFIHSRNRELRGLSDWQVSNECLCDISGYLADISRSLAVIADELKKEGKDD